MEERPEHSPAGWIYCDRRIQDYPYYAKKINFKSYRKLNYVTFSFKFKE